MNMKGMEGVSFPWILNMSSYERDKVIVINELFLVTDFLASSEDGIELSRPEGIPQMLKTGSHGGTTAMLGERQLCFSPAHDLRVHDFVRFAFF
jgi:hypothetical protein